MIRKQECDSIKAPCKGCSERHLYCHDSCEKYKRWKEEIRKSKKYIESKRNPPGSEYFKIKKSIMKHIKSKKET